MDYCPNHHVLYYQFTATKNKRRCDNRFLLKDPLRKGDLAANTHTHPPEQSPLLSSSGPNNTNSKAAWFGIVHIDVPHRIVGEHLARHPLKLRTTYHVRREQHVLCAVRAHAHQPLQLGVREGRSVGVEEFARERGFGCGRGCVHEDGPGAAVGRDGAWGEGVVGDEVEGIAWLGVLEAPAAGQVVGLGDGDGDWGVGCWGEGSWEGHVSEFDGAWAG